MGIEKKDGSGAKNNSKCYNSDKENGIKGNVYISYKRLGVNIYLTYKILIR